jgi:hypothetical protein
VASSYTRSEPSGAIPLRELVNLHNGSVRLRNALAAAEARGVLPFPTVADYVACPDPIAELCRNVRQLGVRTAHELDRIIRQCGAVVEEPALEQCQPPSGQIESLLTDLMVELEGVSLRDALTDVPAGTRLCRILETSVGSRSVGDAISRPADLRTEVLSVGNAGAVTAAELAKELRIYTSRRLREAGHSPEVHDVVLARLFGSASGPAWNAVARAEHEHVTEADSGEVHRFIREILDSCDCGSVFANQVIPPRLLRILRLPGLQERAVADLLIERSRMTAEINRIPAVGRGTVTSFWAACVSTLAQALDRAGASEEQRNEVARVLGIGAGELAPLDGDAEEALEVGPDGTFPDLGQILDRLLARIRGQDVPVIRRRFGLDGRPPETLEEIGSDLGITRERVRQLEKRGLGDLRILAGGCPLRRATDCAWRSAWDALADGDDLITDAEFARFKRAVPGELLLALELLGLDLERWLSDVAVRYPHGWLSPLRDRGPVDEVLIALDRLDAPLLPRAVTELQLVGSRSDVEAALLIGRGHRTLHGYLVEGRLGVRRRRSLVAHALMARSAGAVDLRDLQRDYHAAVPADPCSTRDLSIVMSEAPHLFLEVSENRWSAVGSGGELPAGGRPREQDGPEEVPSEPDVTVASAIRDELARTGPQPLSALLENPRRYLPRDRSPNSVQPTLFMRPDLFARLLPGVYCLWDQIPAQDVVLSGSVPYLLDANQGRFFALARRAQEPWGTFPLWSPRAEYRLCRWLEREGPPDVFRSLLALSSVELWPVEEDQRAIWREKARRDGRYDLVASIRPKVFTVRPDLDRVLAALVELGATGRTSWMALNRIDGRHVASQVGCSLLAALILMGAVQPGDDEAESSWQMEHVASPRRSRELRGRLEAELHEQGRLEWASDIGREVASAVLAGEGRAPAWLPFRRYSELFTLERIVERGEEEPTEERVGEIGRALLAERRMSDLLDWLDSQ